MVYSEIIKLSKTYTPPKSGIYKIICIGGVVRLLAAGRQTQRHDQCQQHRHKLLHVVFLLNCGFVAA